MRKSKALNVSKGVEAVLRNFEEGCDKLFPVPESELPKLKKTISRMVDHSLRPFEAAKKKNSAKGTSAKPQNRIVKKRPRRPLRGDKKQDKKVKPS